MHANDDGGKSGNTLATPPHHTAIQVGVCWYHHTSLVSLNVVVVVAHAMEWMKQGHACGVPPITVSLVCVRATCGVEVAMVAMPPFIPHTHR